MFLRLIFITTFFIMFLVTEPAVANTTVIIERLDKQQGQLIDKVEAFATIYNDLQIAGNFTEELEAQLNSNAPLEQQIHTSNKIIQRELSAVSDALVKIDSLIISTSGTRNSVSELINELYRESGADIGNNSDIQRKRKAVAEALLNNAVTMKFLISKGVVDDPNKKREGQLKTELNQVGNDVSRLGNIQHFQLVKQEFTDMMAELALLKRTLRSRSDHLEAWSFEMLAVETQDKLNNVVSSLSTILNKMDFGSMNNKSQELFKRVTKNAYKNSGSIMVQDGTLEDAIENLERRKSTW